MKRISILLLAIVCLVIGFTAKTGLENEVIAQFFRTYAPWIGAVAVGGLLLIGVVLVTGYLYARHRLRRLLKAETPLTEAQIATGLVDMLTTPEGVADPTPAQRQRALLVNGGTWLMRRQATQFYFNATVTVMGGLIGTATLFLLYEQNQKIDLQNQKITLQTDASIAGSVLLEGSRRAALNADMAALLEAIRAAPDAGRGKLCESVPGVQENCWTQDPSDSDALFLLPENLHGRVDGFLRRSTPYLLAVSKGNDLDFDTPLRAQFGFPNLSPERGQVLETLARNRIALAQFNFTRAQVSRMRLPNVNLRDAFLWGADLPKANLQGADLQGALLFFANLEAADLGGANLQGAHLTATNLRTANLEAANLLGADLGGANLTGANLQGANLQGANLNGANLSSAVLADVNQSDTTEFRDAWYWDDLPPTGLWGGFYVIFLDVCTFDPDKHFRVAKPETCGIQ